MKAEIHRPALPDCRVTIAEKSVLTVRFRFTMPKTTDAFLTRMPPLGNPAPQTGFPTCWGGQDRSERGGLMPNIPIIVIAALMFICSEVPVFALSITGSLMNTVWARENQLPNAEASRTSLYFYEYAHLHATNIGSDNLAAHIQGRIGWKKDEQFTGRLYQGYINYRLPKKFDLRLGRQFLPNDVGFWQMDGARLEIKNLGTIDSRFYGGLTATPWMIEKNRDGIAGIELSRLEVWRVQSKISFLTVFDKDGLNNVILGMRLDVPKSNILDIHRDVHKRLNFSGRGSIDLLTQQVISGYGYLHFSPLSKVNLSFEYRHETPLFPADSIFSIFAFEPLQQTAAVCNIDIFNGLELRGRYARQFFDDDVPINQYSAGFSIKSRYERVFDIRLERLSNIDTKYWRIHSYIGKILTPRLEVGFSHYYNNYKLTRALQMTNAYSYQLNVKYQLSRNLNAFMRIEDNINADYVYNVRVMGYIKIFLGK